MFEDILDELYQNINIEKSKSIEDLKCPKCGSDKLNHYIGYFVSSKEYIAFFKCNSCGKKWKVSMGKDLKINSIEESI